MGANPEAGLLGVCQRLVEMRRLDLAERELGRWLSLHPGDAHGHGLMAWTLALQGRGDEALRAADEAVQLAPDWAYPHSIRANVLEELDRHEESERSVREAIALAPDHAGYHALLAVSLLNQRPYRAEEALRAVDEGLALDANNLACARMRVEALLRLWRLDEAREAAAFALRLSPESSALHEAAGWIELNAGNLAETREHMREALRTDPMNEAAASGLRLAGDVPRFCAALTVQVERWAWPLARAMALFAAELAVLAAGGMLNDVLLVCSLVILAGLEGAMLWVRRRHPHVLAEIRIPGLLTPAEQRDARWTLVLGIGILLLLPMAVLYP
jgi:tetratricopeptide (TPR) repeat protein